jgi:hypothetical protein
MGGPPRCHLTLPVDLDGPWWPARGAGFRVTGPLDSARAAWPWPWPWPWPRESCSSPNPDVVLTSLRREVLRS